LICGQRLEEGKRTSERQVKGWRKGRRGGYGSTKRILLLPNVGILKKGGVERY